jgi:hypothetical protein
MALSLGLPPAVAEPAARAEKGERAAKLVLSAPTGAVARVDGVVVGVTPLEEAIAVEPGRHVVAATLTGHEPYRRELRLRPGETFALSVELETTTQRTVAWWLVSTGAASLGTGIVFGVLAVVRHREASDLAPEDDEPVHESQRAAYDEAISARDDYRVVSGITAGAGLGLFLVGGALFVLDDPTGSGEDEARAPEGSVLSIQPLLGPTVAGAALGLRF